MAAETAAVWKGMVYEGAVDELRAYLQNHPETDVNCLEGGAGALHMSVSQGFIACTTCLVDEFGADVNLREPATGKSTGMDGATPLGVACWLGKLDAVKFLVNNTNADLDLAMARGVTPLSAAATAGHCAVVQELVLPSSGRPGCDVNKQENDGWSALLLACLNGHEEIARFLAQNGADKNHVTKDGTSLANAVVAVRNTSAEA